MLLENVTQHPNAQKDVLGATYVPDRIPICKPVAGVLGCQLCEMAARLLWELSRLLCSYDYTCACALAVQLLLCFCRLNSYYEDAGLVKRS